MSTSTQQGFAFRPRSYFLTDLNTAVLSRIKGKARRAAVRRLGISHVDAPMAEESLSEAEREAVGRLHPSLMGGEYLQDLDPLEVEIARFELESVTADVISLRARRAEGKIHYRLVDEYETLYCITPASSDNPLTFGELVALINGVNTCGLPRSLREWNFENDGGNAAELEHFVKVSSEFYPELAGYYAAEAAAWVAEKRAERGREPEPTVEGVPPPDDCTAETLFERGTRSYHDGDFATARECFEKGTELGYGPAEARLAFLYFYGQGVPQSYEKAKILWERAASKGIAKAQFNLGLLYAGGHGVAQDYALARQWWEQAAAQGDVIAQSSLGYVYASGEGGPQDYGKAREWWERAAHQGDTDAQLNLGKVYLTGRGAPKSLTKAREWFGKAAAQGDAEAQACLRWLNDRRVGYDN